MIGQNKKRFPYIDKAIVKMEAEKGSTHASFLRNGRPNTSSNDTEELRASLIVEVGRKMSQGALHEYCE